MQDAINMDKDQKKEAMFGWIEASIRYSGCFEKPQKLAYADIFGIDMSTVSRHQSQFVNIFEKHCNSPVFERTPEERLKGGRLTVAEFAEIPEAPCFKSMPGLHEWLRAGMPKKHYLEVDLFRGDPESWIMRLIVSSMLVKAPVKIRYHSRSRESHRSISPHSLIKIAGRIHIRAFDHLTNSARDFVLSRISHVEKTDEVDFSDFDPDWDRFETVIVKECLTEKNEVDSRGVRSDFDLDENGMREIRVQNPLVQYLIDNMGDGYRKPVRVTLKER